MLSIVDGTHKIAKVNWKTNVLTNVSDHSTVIPVVSWFLKGSLAETKNSEGIWRTSK